MAGAEAAGLASPAQVKALVPESIFKRAKELASSNKLHAFSFQGPALQKSEATCAGSNPGDNYNLSIQMNVESPSKPVCQCSCPAALQAKGNLCKHVVALLLLRTKELARTAKAQANVSILSDFKLAEDRLAGDKERKATPSDSQATEAFIPSDDRPNLADEETTATASSVSPIIKNSQKRILPSWISEGFCAPNKEVKEKKVARKTISKQEAGDNKGKAGSALEGKRTIQTRGGQGEGALVNKGATKRSRLKKQKDAEDETSHAFADSEAEDSPSECEQNLSSRAGRGNRRRNSNAPVRKGGHPAPKRRRTRGYVESDLSEEDEPEVLDNDCPSDSKEDLDLTTEDLVNLANEHLETDNSNNIPGQYQPGENAVINDNHQKDAAAPKKKGSIFSVQGWNEIATKSLDARNASFCQETSEMPVLPSTFVDKGNSQASAELSPNLPSTVCGGKAKSADSLEPAENIVDDMLGLFFGPNLSKTVNPKLESSQDFVEDVTPSSLAPLPDTDMLDVVLPASVDSVPKPKKKASLKDKVLMYLG
eukprot:c16530_g1_i1 orf=50-1666(+)